MSTTNGRGKRGLGLASLSLLEHAAALADAHGPITVRGICYKLFVQGHIPSMARNEVQRVGRLLVYAREHGIIDWDDIVDETRQVERPPMWSTLAAFGKAIERSYRLDTGQPNPTTCKCGLKNRRWEGFSAP